MKKESKERRKIVRKVKNQINTDFNKSAKQFITEIFKLEKREIPKFEKMTSDGILKIYSETQLELLGKLMRQRQRPIDSKYLDGLLRINSRGILPKSIKITLESLAL